VVVLSFATELTLVRSTPAARDAMLESSAVDSAPRLAAQEPQRPERSVSCFQCPQLQHGGVTSRSSWLCLVR